MGPLDEKQVCAKLPPPRHLWSKEVAGAQRLEQQCEGHGFEAYRGLFIPSSSFFSFLSYWLGLKTSRSRIPNNNSTITEEQLWVTAMDLFAAGSETTATTLAWAVLYMVLHPEAQVKVQDEIDQVVGRDRAPSLDDRGE